MPDQSSETLQDETFSGPLLLRGIRKPSGVEEVLASMPARPLVDLLVSRFFNSAQPSIGKRDLLLQAGMKIWLMLPSDFALHKFPERGKSTGRTTRYQC